VLGRGLIERVQIPTWWKATRAGHRNIPQCNKVGRAPGLKAHNLCFHIDAVGCLMMVAQVTCLFLLVLPANQKLVRSSGEEQ
jgi:hypothetical protein